MNKVIIIKIIFTILSILLGVLLHFTYEMSNKNKIVGLFSATNESTWEHLKLAFFPTIILAIIEYLLIGKYVNNFVETVMMESILSITLIPIFFYSYKNIFKKDNFIVDILIFVISIIISNFVGYRLMIIDDFSTVITKVLSIIVILLIKVSFIIFTYNPPKLELFKDPLK